MAGFWHSKRHAELECEGLREQVFECMPNVSGAVGVTAKDLDRRIGKARCLCNGLSATATGRNDVTPGLGFPRSANDRNSCDLAKPEGLLRRAERNLFRALSQSIAGIFDICSENGFSIYRFNRASDEEIRIRRVGTGASFAGQPEQLFIRMWQ